MICYHITTEDRLNSILKDGLQPNSARNRSAKPAPFIMLSQYPQWHLFKNWKKDKQLILIEINHPAIKPEMFNGDPDGLAWEKLIPPEYFNNMIKFEVIK